MFLRFVNQQKFEYSQCELKVFLTAPNFSLSVSINLDTLPILYQVLCILGTYSLALKSKYDLLIWECTNKTLSLLSFET